MPVGTVVPCLLSQSFQSGCHSCSKAVVRLLQLCWNSRVNSGGTVVSLQYYVGTLVVIVIFIRKNKIKNYGREYY